VTPSDITWPNLARPYEVSHPDGRRHSAYTPALFGRAVTMGWDPAGHDLSVVMPRYQIAPDDLSDLIAYIRQIDHVAAPGVSESSIRIGIVLPPPEPFGPRPDAVIKTISDYMETINRSGGIYRRTLNPINLVPDQATEPDVFALLGGFSPDGDASPRPAVMAQIPSVYVYPPPDLARPADRSELFALVSGHAGQARSLASYIADRRIGFDSGIAVIHGPDGVSRALAEEIAGRLRCAGAKNVIVKVLADEGGSASDTAIQNSAQGTAAVLLVGPADRTKIGALVTTLAGLSKDLMILIPAALGDQWLFAPPPVLAGRLFVARPMSSWVPVDGADALAAVKLLVEGLKGAGRNLDRETFIKALERVSTSASSAAPARSFGPGRRIGSRGASVIRLAPAGRAYELIESLIDPGPSTDDPPVDSGVTGS
jgi:hypothetical protein